MRKKISPVVLALVLLLTVVSVASAASFVVFDGFESETTIWFDLTRVPSGTNNVTSASGDYHAEVPLTVWNQDAELTFTRWGGYGGTFPVGGYSTFVDVYLDTAKSLVGEDIRFDYTSAISTPAGGHRRDFIFNAGTNGSGGFVVSASNNAPGNPAGGLSPLTISQSGWYTFKHSFYDNGFGVLAVDMSVVDADDNVLQTWTRSDPSDVIGTTVGGNRYGWFATNGFNFLAIDNSMRSGGENFSSASCKDGGWQTLTMQDGMLFDNQGQCIQYFNTGK